jgi:hypothetical protein
MGNEGGQVRQGPRTWALETHRAATNNIKESETEAIVSQKLAADAWKHFDTQTVRLPKVV